MERRNHLGRFIRECRTELGYTSRKVEELSRSAPGLTAISHSNLLAIEKGVHVPTFDKVLTLALILKVPTHHFEEELRRDMLDHGRAPGDEPAEDLIESGRAALARGEHAAALEHFVQAVAAAEHAYRAAPGEGAGSLLAEARLAAANGRARCGLVRVAKDDVEGLLAAPWITPRVVVRATFLLAEIHRELGNPRLALLHARAALDQLGLLSGEGDRILRGKLLNSLGNVLDDSGAPSEATTCYLEALAIFRAEGDRRACGLVARNLGEAHLGRGELDAAVSYLGEGVRVARETGDRRGLAYGLANLARAHHRRGADDECRACAREAKTLAQAEGYLDALFTSVYYLWKAAQAGGQASLARAYAERLAVLARKLESRCPEADEWSQHVRSPRRVHS